jgi:branched-chain amino acid transport system substrate-binding protein
MVDPLTGVSAALAQSEVAGANLAIENINKKGGVLDGELELLVESSGYFDG